MPARPAHRVLRGRTPPREVAVSGGVQQGGVVHVDLVRPVHQVLREVVAGRVDQHRPLGQVVDAHDVGVEPGDRHQVRAEHGLVDVGRHGQPDARVVELVDHPSRHRETAVAGQRAHRDVADVRHVPRDHHQLQLRGQTRADHRRGHHPRREQLPGRERRQRRRPVGPQGHRGQRAPLAGGRVLQHRELPARLTPPHTRHRARVPARRHQLRGEHRHRVDPGDGRAQIVRTQPEHRAVHPGPPPMFACITCEHCAAAPCRPSFDRLSADRRRTDSARKADRWRPPVN